MASEEVTLVPDTVAEIHEWADYPPLCNVSTGDPHDDCNRKAKYLVRAENHKCKRHDGRFRFVCQAHMERFIANKGFAICAWRWERPRVALIEVRDL